MTKDYIISSMMGNAVDFRHWDSIEKFVTAAKNSGNEKEMNAMAYNIRRPALTGGIDVTDENEVEKFISKKPSNLHAVGNTTMFKRKKIGRNDPCPCGSGKKYKKCCLPKERGREKKDLESIDDLPLYKVLISEEPGSRAIAIARERWNGNIAFIYMLIDEWKMGLKDCFGGYDVSKTVFHKAVSSLPLVDANLDECKKLIKRGLLIAKEVGTKTPKEFDRLKAIIGKLDKVQVGGSLYKCFKCGKGDLSDEKVEYIKKVTREDMNRGVCGTPNETMIYFVCNECKNRSADEMSEWLDEEEYETRENYMEKVKKSLRKLSVNEYREILEKEGWDTWGPVACMECGNEENIGVECFAVDGNLEPNTTEEENVLFKAVKEFSKIPELGKSDIGHLFIGSYLIISIPTCSKCGSHRIFSDF